MRVALDKASPGWYKVVDLYGGYGFLKKLADLGIYPGSELQVLAPSTQGGPIRVLVKGSQVGMGRGMASRITVERVKN